MSGIYRIDSTNTEIRFSAKHFGVINVNGHFGSFQGQISIEEGIVHSSQITIDVASITTGSKSRDRSLKSEDFLDAPGFPKILVSIEKNTDPASIPAKVQIKNVKRFLTIEYQLTTKEGRLELEAHCVLSRNDFELDFGSMDDLVSDEVKISASVTLKVK